MRPILLFLVGLLALGATAAHAGQGVNLRWSECFGDGGAFHRSFACDTNAGNHVLVGSFELWEGTSHIIGQESYVDIVVPSTVFPGWWEFRNPGSCRMSSLSVSFTLPATAGNCLDWPAGQHTGVVSYMPGFYADIARIHMATATDPASSDLGAGIEYFAFSVMINNAKTVGADACSGCTLSACIVYSGTKLSTGSIYTDRTVYGATNLTDSYFVTWQGPTAYPPLNKACPYPVPTTKRTWGAVKALYR